MSVLAPPVTVVTANAPPFVNVPSGAPPFVAVAGNAPPIMLVDAGAPPITLYNDDGSLVGSGAALLVGETDGLAVDFTCPTEGQRLAVKVAGVTTSYALDDFLTNTGGNAKQVYDKTGALVWSPHNFFLNSEDITQASYTKNNATTPSATRVVETTANAAHSLQIPSTAVAVGETYCYSVEATAAECSSFALFNSTQSYGKGFDLAVGVPFDVAGISSAGLANYGMLNLGNGRYRCWIAVTAASTPVSHLLYMMNGAAFSYPGDTSRGLTVHRHQLNRGTVPAPYISTTSAARPGCALTYDPVTHAPLGLLVEPSAQNLLLNNAVLATQNVTVTAVQHTLSFFGTGTIALTGVSTAGPLVGTGANNRVSLNFTPTAGTLTVTVTGSVLRGQLEISPNGIASSPVVTFAAANTRNADNVKALTSQWPWSAAGANSIVFQAAANQAVANHTYLTLHDGTDNERYLIDTSSATKILRLFTADGGVAQTDLGAVGTPVPGTYYKMALALALNDFATCINAGAVQTDNLGTLPTVTTLQIGGARAQTAYSQYIKTLKIVPRRMSNAELQAQTT